MQCGGGRLELGDAHAGIDEQVGVRTPDMPDVAAAERTRNTSCDPSDTPIEKPRLIPEKYVFPKL